MIIGLKGRGIELFFLSFSKLQGMNINELLLAGESRVRQNMPPVDNFAIIPFPQKISHCTDMDMYGIVTNFGVESTARFTYEYGYQKIFAEDAMSALSAEEYTSRTQ
jgi:Isochorismatase family